MNWEAGGVMRVLLVVLTALLAASMPLRYVLAWASPDLASAIGSPYLRSLPSPTLVILSVSITVHAVLMISVVKQVWQLAGVFRTGVFFSKMNVSRIRKISIFLLLTSALGFVTFVLGVWSLILAGQQIQWDKVWVRGFDLPIGTLVCGLLSLTMARAFDEARKLADESRFTV